LKKGYKNIAIWLVLWKEFTNDIKTKNTFFLKMTDKALYPRRKIFQKNFHSFNEYLPLQLSGV